MLNKTMLLREFMNSLNDNKNIYFRVDFGGLIGRGHLSRTLSLAEIFKENGYNPIFLVRKRPSIEQEELPFETVWLNRAPDVVSTKTETWSVGTMNNEASEVLEVVKKNSIIILDHYGLGIEFQRALKVGGQRVVMFQDVFNEQFEADILINYNLTARDLYSESFKKSRKTKFVLGPKYTPLNLAYAHENVMQFSDLTVVQSVGIYLGGVTEKQLEIVARLVSGSNYFLGKKIEWVVNSENEKDLLLRKLENVRAEIFVRLPEMRNLYKRVQLFIGTCGVAFLERACMGLWQINFVVADNQKSLGEYLLNNKITKSVLNLLDDQADVKSLFNVLLSEEVSSITTSILNLKQLINKRGAYELYQEIEILQESLV